MHPAISYHLARAHVAELRHRAERHLLARAARLARRDHRQPTTFYLGRWAGGRRPRRSGSLPPTPGLTGSPPPATGSTPD